MPVNPAKTDLTSTQVDARVEGQRIKGHAIHGGYFDVPLFSHVGGNLWVGGTPADNPDLLHIYEGDKLVPILRPRFDKILCLYPWEPYVAPQATEKVEVELYDSLAQAVEQIPALADQVCAWLDDDQRVLIHCQAGLNRSNLVAALVLMKWVGKSAVDAIDILRTRRHEEVLCNPHFVNYLINYKVEV